MSALEALAFSMDWPECAIICAIMVDKYRDLGMGLMYRPGGFGSAEFDALFHTVE